MPNGLNQYGSVSGTTYGYDRNGNLTSDGASTFSYDIENRLTGATGAKNAVINYDPLGRIFQTGGGAAGTTTFLYDGDALVARYDSAGTMLRRYAHGPGVDEPLLWYEGADFSVPRYFHADNQGSIAAVSTSSGNKYVINTYDDYGVPGSGNIGQFQYTGQVYIPETGLFNYKARFYSPALGRFMQTDPVGYEDQVNLYAYVANDPVNLIDHDGQRAATAGEARLLHNAFGGVLDSQAGYALLIMDASWTTSLLSRGRSFNGPMGSINFSRKDYKSDFSKIPASERGTFYHEFWHRFELTIGKSSIEGLFVNQAGGSFGNGTYNPKAGASFWNQNPEARADIFSNAMVTGNFHALSGVSGRIDSTTSFKFDEKGLSVIKHVTGSRIPRITRYDWQEDKR